MNWTIRTNSSFQLNLFSRQNVERTAQALQKAGQEVATGRKADIYTDLGSRSASVMKLRIREEDTQTYMQSNNLIANKLQLTINSMDKLRDTIQSVVETTFFDTSQAGSGASLIQTQARAALDELIGTMNTSFNGEHVFAGLASEVSPLTRWADTNPATGMSPEDVISGIVGSGPADVASVSTISTALDVIFTSADTGNPAHNYEETFFNGTNALDAGGAENRRITAWVAAGQELEYGVQANDEAIRQTYKGLAMLITADTTTMDTATYRAWVAEISDTLAKGQEGLLQISARTGFNQEVVEKAQIQLTDLSLVQRNMITDYENVDPYEAITRMTNLERQLEATYQVTARLSGLSILAFLR